MNPIRDILYLIFLFLFFDCLGDILFSCLRIKKNGHLFRISLGLVATSYITLFMANYGWLDRNLAFVLMTVIIFVRIKKVLQLPILIGRKTARFISNLNAHGSQQLKAFFIILILQVGINFFLTLTPPTGWDSLAYHLTIPKLILREGKMIDLASSGGVSYPLSIEMLYTICLLFRDGGLAKLLSWAIGILTIWAIYELALTASRKDIGIIGGAIFYGTQVVSMWAGKCYVDISLAFFTTIAVLATIKFSKDKKFSNWILVAVFIAALPGIKYNGVFLALIIGLYAVLQLFTISTGRRWRWSFSIGALVILLVMGIILNSQWYLDSSSKDAIGKTCTSAADIIVVSMQNPIKVYLERFFFSFWRLTLFYELDGRIGPVFLAFIPLLIFMRPQRDIKIWLIISLGYLLLFPLLGLLHSRYILPLFPLLSLISAYSYEEIRQWGRSLGYLLCVILLFTLIFNIGLTLYNHRPELLFLTKRCTEREYLQTRVRVFPAIDYINKNIKDGKILLIGESRAYYLERPFLWGHIIRGKENDKLKPFLEQNKITHLLVNERIIYKKKPDKEMREILRYLSDKMALIYQHGHFKIYELK